MAAKTKHGGWDRDIRVPFSSSKTIRERMQRQSRRDTKPELAVRCAAHSMGLRYFVDRRPIPAIRSKADMVFPRARVAVFVDGCFWHGCPEHGTMPKSNVWYWREKIGRNQERDGRTDAALKAAGWAVVRAWEHEEPERVAWTIRRAVRRHRRA